MRRFKTKDLRRLHKAGQIKSHWDEIYQMRYKKTLAGDLFKERVSGWLLRIAAAIMLGAFVAMHPAVLGEKSFAVVILACGVLLLCLLAWFLLESADDRLTRFVDDLRLIADWSNRGPGLILGLKGANTLSLATDILAAAAARSLVYRQRKESPEDWNRHCEEVGRDFEQRLSVFASLGLAGDGGWDPHFEAGQKLIDDGLYPPKIPS